MNKVREGIQKKIREIESKKAEIEGERDKLKDENNQLQSRKYFFFIEGCNVYVNFVEVIVDLLSWLQSQINSAYGQIGMK